MSNNDLFINELYNNCLAHQDNVFNSELAPVTIKVKKSDVTVDVDEHPKPKTTLETLAKLPTVFKKDGVVTAGSASVSACSTYTVYFSHNGVLNFQLFV